MAGEEIELDQSAVEAVRAREPLDVASALALEGSGWDGDLEAIRASRA